MTDSIAVLGQAMPTSGVILVTGTDTGVGKTVVSAAVASMLTRHGVQAHIYKPVQTGLVSTWDPRREDLQQLYGDSMVLRGDAQVAGQLAGCSYSTGASFTLPMAPQAAAAGCESSLPTAGEHALRIQQLLHHHDVVIVEGAGGLVVDLGDHTLADIACQLQQLHLEVNIVVVARANLGTLNHTALTLEALRHRGLHHVGVAIGSWPGHPTPVESSNRDQLARSYSLVAVIPEGSGALDPEAFQAQTLNWFGQDQDNNPTAMLP
ncbi:MAG: dethiobiotin synthase [Yaniella sp.]|uniref:dethiobiotin synthase n=2 Tax=Yaniella sp. TaxID=2773929 RepID=UPI002647249C|nr:dethiobiotin synthase [Yaniella sp.]MDN5703785.1 dethiobiotin synthase [Yaniella sp.]MDN5731680.1 dethiobiotin synthase [Yaniella sp.]MDN5815626.1 dethiobiotin synthase [Yaniella sp.]MDN5818110.1 dethiobiotin synthase [Yaniella sp.]MDN5838382.1 dethiobiotin synthase [Yaniella sp.]